MARTYTEHSSWALATTTDTKRSTPDIGDVAWAPVLLNMEPLRCPRRFLRCGFGYTRLCMGVGVGMVTACYQIAIAPACRTRMHDVHPRLVA